MKKTILLLFCLMAAAAALAKDYKLVATQLRGATPSGTPAEFPIVYVLLAPDVSGRLNPLVYKSFDSTDMELDMRGLVKAGIIAPGSVLHFDGTPALTRPSDEQIQTFKDFCKKLGVTFTVDLTQ